MKKSILTIIKFFGVIVGVLLLASSVEADLIVGSGGNAWSGNSSFDNTSFQMLESGDVTLWDLDDFNDGLINDGWIQTMGTWFDEGINITGNFWIDVQDTSTYINKTVTNTDTVSIYSSITSTDRMELGGVTAPILGYTIYHDNTGDQNFSIWIGGAQSLGTYTTDYINWTFSLNGTHINIYRDGILYFNTIDDSSSFSKVTIGSETGNRNGNLKIDWIRMYQHGFVNSGNLTTWHDSGSGNETYRIDINFSSIPTNTNYTTYYHQNATGDYVQIGTANHNSDQSISLSTKYQNTDIIIQLFGNTTATPELANITFFTQTVNGETDFIPPTPINCMSSNGTTWINLSCSSGTGNITNSMNFTNTNLSTWNNNSVFYWNNTGLTESTLYVYRIYPFNSSGTGSLNLTYATISNTTSSVTEFIATLSDLMFTANASENWQFRSNLTGSLTWMINKSVQSNTTDDFIWTVPAKDNVNRLYNIYEISASNGTDTVEWLVSTLSLSEAPDKIDSFTDGLYNNRIELDPWGRNIINWSINGGTWSAANRYLVSTASSEINVATNTSDFYGTYVIDSYNTNDCCQPSFYLNNITSGANIGANWYYKATPDVHFFPTTNVYDTGVPEYYANIYASKQLVKNEFDDASSRRHPGALYTWYRVVIVIIPDGDYTRVEYYSTDNMSFNMDLRMLPFSRIWEKNQSIIHPNSINLTIGYGGDSGDVRYDNMYYFKNWYFNGSGVEYNLTSSTIEIKGSQTLQTINDSINNASQFIYYPSNNTAYSYGSIRLDGGASLNITNETLVMTPSSDGQQYLYMFNLYEGTSGDPLSGNSELNIINSTIKSSTGYRWNFYIYSGGYLRITDSNLTNINIYSKASTNMIMLNSSMDFYEMLKQTHPSEMDRYLYGTLYKNSTLNKKYDGSTMTIRDVDDNLTFYHKIYNGTPIQKNPLFKDINFISVGSPMVEASEFSMINPGNITTFSAGNGAGNVNVFNYLDIIVTDGTSPINGATITLIGNNSNASVMDYYGNSIISIDTENDGHTPLPLGNESNTIIVKRITANQPSSGILNYYYSNYTINVSKSGYITNSSVTIVPQSSWYRSNPNTYQNTTTIVLQSETPSYSISGYVNDTLSVPISSVSVVNSSNSTTTNVTGYYNLTMSNGSYNFTFSKAGYTTGYKNITIDGADVTNQNVTLIPSIPVITNVINSSINSTSQLINWSVNLTTNNQIVYDNGSVKNNSGYCSDTWSVGYECGYATDSNWSSYAESAGALTQYIYFNYSIPTNANQTFSLWHVKDAEGQANLTIPTACWNSITYLRAAFSDIGNSVIWGCDNGGGWTNLRSSVANIAYEEEMIFKYTSTWDNSTISPSITLSGLTPDTTYSFTSWSYNPADPSYNSSSASYTFTTGSSTSSSIITVPANSWGMFNNWSWDTNFSNIAANETNDVAYTFYNSTSGEWEAYFIGYPAGASNPIGKHNSVLGFFNAETIITADTVTPSDTALIAGWNMLYLEGTSNRTIEEIIYDIEGYCALSDSTYIYNTTIADYSGDTSEIVVPNQGFLTPATTNCTWVRTTI